MSYKRIDHFKQMLKQYQGKSECPMGKNEFDIIENEIREQELTYNLHLWTFKTPIFIIIILYKYIR